MMGLEPADDKKLWNRLHNPDTPSTNKGDAGRSNNTKCHKIAKINEVILKVKNIHDEEYTNRWKRGEQKGKLIPFFYKELFNQIKARKLIAFRLHSASSQTFQAVT